MTKKKAEASIIWKWLRWIDEYVEEVLVVALLFFLVGAVNIEVFRRYVLNSSGAYSEEIARYVMIWMIYLGVPYAIKQRRHIVCDVLPAGMSPRLDITIDTISYLLFFLFCLFMAYQSYSLVALQIEMGKRTEAMHVPIWYFSIAIGVGFSLGALRLFQIIYHTIGRLRRPGAEGPAWPWNNSHQETQ